MWALRNSTSTSLRRTALSTGKSVAKPEIVARSLCGSSARKETTFRPWESQHPEAWFSARPGANGFLPRGQPLKELPAKYAKINDLLERMKIGSGGLLATGSLGSAVENELIEPIDVSTETDPQLLAALHRDFAFLASAYSLEPAHQRLQEGDGVYGRARTYLPASISEPLLQLGSKLGVFPWLDYAHGYGLNNAVLREGGDPTRFDDYHTIRMFHGSASESGFINVHVAMVAETGALLGHQQDCLEAAAAGDTGGLADALNAHGRVLSSIVATLQTMWGASKPSDYLSFRTFIMGQTGNANCYPDQVINFVRLDGTAEKHAYRGETGAQDSIVPSVDNLLQLDYPRNKLTEYLWDLRAYRPVDHQAYLDYNKAESSRIGLRRVAASNARSALAVLRNLDCLRTFRGKHWNLTKAYIIRNTKHPTATGGTPITTWLPNQLGATLEYQGAIVQAIDEHLAEDRNALDRRDLDDFSRMKVELTDHVQRLMEEVQALQNNGMGEQEHASFMQRTEHSRRGVFQHTHNVAMSSSEITG